MSNVEIARHLTELCEKMDRYEAHRIELKKDVKAVSDRQAEMVTLLAGSDLNGKKGVLNLIDEIDKRTRTLEVENQNTKNDMEIAKFWGKGIVGVTFVTIGLMIKKLLSL